MATKSLRFSKGDWIVHRYHGVGEIRGTATRTLGDNTNTYYKVVTENSTFFVPVDDIDTDRIRPLITPETLKEGLEILKSPPEELDENTNSRKSHIKSVRKEGTFKDVCELVRDLYAHQLKVKRLNVTEKRAYEKLTERLIREWAVCMKINMEEARKRFEKLLQENANMPEPA